MDFTPAASSLGPKDGWSETEPVKGAAGPGPAVPDMFSMGMKMMKGLVPGLAFCILLSGVPALADAPLGNATGITGATRNPQENDHMTDTNSLTAEEGEYLISVARKTIAQRLSGQTDRPDDAGLPPKCLEKRGTFVTLTKSGHLRGCIGHILPMEPLIDGVRANAVNAAFNDPRFPPLSRDELSQIKVEVSILTEPVRLSYSGAHDLIGKLRPGIDGVIIRRGYHQAVFLPQVWDQLPKKEEFLGHLCMKAGLPSDAWKKGDLEVSIYQVQAFEEE